MIWLNIIFDPFTLSCVLHEVTPYKLQVNSNSEVGDNFEFTRDCMGKILKYLLVLIINIHITVFSCSEEELTVVHFSRSPSMSGTRNGKVSNVPQTQQK